MLSNNQIPIYSWDNEENLVEAQDCRLVQTKKSSFNIIKNTDPLDTMTTILSQRENKTIGSILANTLISITATRNIEEVKQFHEKIKIVGVNMGPEFFLQEGYVLRRDEQTYVHKDLIHKLSGFEILSKLYIDEKHKLVKFKIVIEDENYIKLQCDHLPKTRLYTLFNVYDINDQLISYIAVSGQETSIFKEIRITKAKQLSKEVIQVIKEIQEIKEIKETIEPTEKEISENINIQEPDVISSDIGKYICMPRYTYLNARDESLKKIIFKMQSGQKIKIFQGWSENDKTKIIRGQRYIFKKVQLYNVEAKDQEIAWVAEKYITSKNDCKHFDSTLDLNNILESDFIGLDDEICCTFPTIKKPTESLTIGQTKFKHSRANNRLHAAVDLYRYENEAVVSVAPGEIIRAPYAFYLGTNALVVKHISGFVVRYGELSASVSISKIKKGRKVKAGEKLGFIGRLNGNCCTPMLHFELYEGTKKGPLTIKAKWKKGEVFRGQSLRGNARFRRRSDLLDPTKYLLDWHLKTFKVKAK